MKHFSNRLHPEKTDSPVLPHKVPITAHPYDALAYVECSVSNRLECGDHWLVYAVVDNGKLLQSDNCVHHRKSGNHYGNKEAGEKKLRTGIC